MTDVVVRPQNSFSNIEMTETAWLPSVAITYEQWEKAGRTLLRMGRAWQWWTGDWILYGEARFADSYAQAIELTGLEYQTIANVIAVCRSVEHSRRRENLSFAHHAEVSALQPSQQSEWLDRAEHDGMTVARLRAAIRAARRAGTPQLMPDDNLEFAGILQIKFGAYDDQAASEKLQELAAVIEKRGVIVTSRSARSLDRPEP